MDCPKNQKKKKKVKEKICFKMKTVFFKPWREKFI